MAGFTGSYRGIGQLLVSEMIRGELLKRAERVKARAEATAPDAIPLGEGYKYEFEIEVGTKHGKTTRAFARVKNTSDHALYVEFGGGNTPRHRTLGKAIDAAK